ncbi:MAG: organoarsenical effux MFS transporter ArsJ [Phycisphaerales bacterium]|nr:organoarsenical effux MFS transporter ArsJ [Phycisphaerales bacterium]
MNVRSYALVTGAYWAFTITDGALRMLVLLHFAFLGYDPLTLAFLFLLYEFCGVVTNLCGGWLGTRFGLRSTLLSGLALQVVALVALSFVNRAWLPWVSVVWVMGAQGMSGIAKDLTKMSAKSALKFIVKDADRDVEHSRLFTWVAVLTGSKNTLKGVGFFVGGGLLAWLGFTTALWAMAGGLFVVLCLGLLLVTDQLGTLRQKPSIRTILSKSPAINRLSLARFFLFGARDIWFVVGLPLYLYEVLEWSFEGVGAFMACWVIGYGLVQSLAPRFVARGGRVVESARLWALALALVTLSIALATTLGLRPERSILVGLAVFGVVFAINSSIHSFLILAYTDDRDVALDVGFYYSANAAGRLAGTLFSGLAYLGGGITACLWTSAAFLLVAWCCSLALPGTTSAGELAGES